MSTTLDMPMGASTHEPETAGRLMVAKILRAMADDTVATVRRRLASERQDIVDPVCVVDEDGRFLGAVPLPQLLPAREELPMRELMRSDWPTVHPAMDQEHVAALARERHLAAVPVADESGRLLGCVPAITLLDVIYREHVEDVHRLVGILHQSATAIHAIEDPPIRRFLRRIPWLLVGLGGSMVATAVMARFEGALAADVRIVFFIPAIVYLADAIGTQTEAIAVRGLSLGRPRFLRALWSEVATGGLIGSALALVAFALVWAVFGNLGLSLAVAAALLAAGTVASLIGLLFPWGLSKLGVDPAFGSGPVATIIQDVTSILIYLGIVAALVVSTA